MIMSLSLSLSLLSFGHDYHNYHKICLMLVFCQDEILPLPCPSSWWIDAWQRLCIWVAILQPNNWLMASHWFIFAFGILYVLLFDFLVHVQVPCIRLIDVSGFSRDRCLVLSCFCPFSFSGMNRLCWFLPSLWFVVHLVDSLSFIPIVHCVWVICPEFSPFNSLHWIFVVVLYSLWSLFTLLIPFMVFASFA